MLKVFKLRVFGLCRVPNHWHSSMLMQIFTKILPQGEREIFVLSQWFLKKKPCTVYIVFLTYLLTQNGNNLVITLILFKINVRAMLLFFSNLHYKLIFPKVNFVMSKWHMYLIFTYIKLFNRMSDWISSPFIRLQLYRSLWLSVVRRSLQGNLFLFQGGLQPCLWVSWNK